MSSSRAILPEYTISPNSQNHRNKIEQEDTMYIENSVQMQQTDGVTFYQSRNEQPSSLSPGLGKYNMT